MRFVRQTLMLLLLSFALAVPAVSAADLETQSTRQAGQSSSAFLERLWQLFTGLWSDVGCRLDPLGSCSAGSEEPPQSDTDAGCHIDPLGGLDEGCRIDPLGGCWD